MSLLDHVAPMGSSGRRYINSSDVINEPLLLLILKASPGKWFYNPFLRIWIEHEQTHLDPGDEGHPQGHLPTADD